MILGHQKQWQFLKKSVELGKLSHAYLFCGEEGVGKEKLALEFAKLVNCENKDFKIRPCQKCRSCVEIQKGICPDVSLIKPQSKEIQISQIRDLKEKFSLKSYSSLFKVAILDQAHCMGREAQSAFLKLLEEPKGKTIFILLTPFPEMLLPTIISRVQRIRLHSLNFKEIEKYLKEQGVPEIKAQEISLLSGGRPGRAIDLYLDSKKLEKQNRYTKELVKLCSSSLGFRFKWIKNLNYDFSELKEILEIWLRYFRNILLLRINSNFYEHQFDKCERNQISGDIYLQLPQYSLLKIKKILKLILSLNFLISSTNINPKLALEILMIEL